MDNFEIYMNDAPLKFESDDLIIKGTITDSADWYDRLVHWKNLTTNNTFKVDCDLIDLNYTFLKKLVKPKYPRKMKKRIFGTKKAKNKLKKKIKQKVPINFSDFKRAGIHFKL